LGLVLGKPIGIVSVTWLITRTRHASLARGIGWADISAMAVLAGIGFTVSLLVAELAFGVGHPRDEHAKLAVLSASFFAALVGSALLWWRGRVHRARAERAETAGGPGGGAPPDQSGSGDPCGRSRVCACCDISRWLRRT